MCSLGAWVVGAECNPIQFMKPSSRISERHSPHYEIPSDLLFERTDVTHALDLFIQKSATLDLEIEGVLSLCGRSGEKINAIRFSLIERKAAQGQDTGPDTCREAQNGIH
jgi:hypothetical protein